MFATILRSSRDPTREAASWVKLAGMIVAVLNRDRATLSTYVRRLDRVPFSGLRRLYELSVPPSFRGTEVHAVSNGIAKRKKSRVRHGETNAPPRRDAWSVVKRCLPDPDVIAIVCAVSRLAVYSPVNVRNPCPRAQSGQKATSLSQVQSYPPVAARRRLENGIRGYRLACPCPASLRSAHGAVATVASCE